MKTNKPNYFNYINNYSSSISSQSASKKYLSKTWLKNKRREDAQHTKNTVVGNFCCARCNKYYSLNYGKFGKFGCFEDSTYYCVDCIESSRGFVAMK